MADEEILVTVSLRFPLTDPPALSEHIAPIVREAFAAGGLSAHVTVQRIDADEDE